MAEVAFVGEAAAGAEDGLDVVLLDGLVGGFEQGEEFFVVGKAEDFDASDESFVFGEEEG